MPDVARSIHHRGIARRVTRAISSLFIIGCVTLLSSRMSVAAFDDMVAAGAPVTEASITAGTVAELHGYLLGREANVDLFRARGPFGVAIQKDRELSLTSSQRVKTDVYLSVPGQN